MSSGTMQETTNEEQRTEDFEGAVKKMMKDERNIDTEEETHPCGRPSCRTPASKKCSRCRTVFYCSRECMAACWGDHRKVCRCVVLVHPPLTTCRRPEQGGIVVRKVAGKGLGVLATRDFLPGEVVMMEEPLLLTKDGEQVGTCT